MNVAGMERQIRRAAMAFLPEESNGALSREVPGTLNEAGDPTVATVVSVPYRIYLTRMRQASGDWRPEGIRPDGEQEAIVAPLEAPGAIIPEPGDKLMTGSGSRYRVRIAERQDVDDESYWLVRLERIQ